MNESVRIETLTVTLSDPSLQGDKTRLAAETDQLKDRIGDFVYSVDDAVTRAPDRSRGLDVPMIGAFVIALAPARQIIREVVRLADTWIRNRPARRVELEIRGEKITMEGLSGRDLAEITTRVMDILNQDSPIGITEQDSPKVITKGDTDD